MWIFHSEIRKLKQFLACFDFQKLPFEFIHSNERIMTKDTPAYSVHDAEIWYEQNLQHRQWAREYALYLLINSKHTNSEHWTAKYVGTNKGT